MDPTRMNAILLGNNKGDKGFSKMVTATIAKKIFQMELGDTLYYGKINGHE